MSNFVQLRPVRVELLYEDRRTDGRTDGQTDMTKLIVASRNFAKAPEKETPIHKITNMLHWQNT
jgi:hypothetical protein